MSPALFTKRLRLDHLADADVPAIVAFHADARVTPLLMDTVPDTPALAALFVAWAGTHYPHGYGTFAARRQGSSDLAGLFSLTPFEGTDDLELGGKLARSGWGRDLAVEAGAALVAHAFGALGRATLVSAVHPDNRAAAAALARLGFAFEREGEVAGTRARIHRLRTADWAAQGAKPLGPRAALRINPEAEAPTHGVISS